MDKEWRQRNEWFDILKARPVMGRACDVIVKLEDGTILEGSATWGPLGFELREDLPWHEVLLWKYFPRERKS